MIRSAIDRSGRAFTAAVASLIDSCQVGSLGVMSITGRPLRSVPNWMYWAVVCASSFALLYAAWAQLLLQLLHRFRFPFRDFVFVTEELDKLPALNPLTPWKGPAIGQHQVIYPNSFYMLDQIYFGANGNLLYSLIYGFTILSSVLLIIPVVTSLRTRSNGSTGIMAAALFSSCVIYWFCSGYNWENLTFQIQLCETACIAFMILGFLAATQVSLYGGQNDTLVHDSVWAGLAGAFCHIATFSWGAGLVCWPILLAYSVLYRWRRAPFLILSCIGIVTIAMFFYLYVQGHYEGGFFYQSFGTGLTKPVSLLYFVLNVFAWPLSLAFGDFLPLRISRILTLALTLPIAVFALMTMARYHARNAIRGNAVGRQAVFFSMLVAGAVCSAALAAVFRSGALVGWGQSRYGIFSALFWLGLTGWSLCISERLIPRGLAALTAISLLMAFIPWRYYELDIRSREQGTYQAGALATFGLGIEELPSLNGADPLQFEMWRRPRRNAPSFAEREPFGWFGRPVASLGSTPTEGYCGGDVERTASLKDSHKIFMIDGWAVGKARNGPLAWVLVVNKRGIVIGGGKPGLPSDDLVNRLSNSKLQALSLTDARNARFSLVALNDQADQFSLWGVRRNGVRCEIAEIKQRQDRSCDKNCGLDEWSGIGLPS